VEGRFGIGQCPGLEVGYWASLEAKQIFQASRLQPSAFRKTGALEILIFFFEKH